MTFMSDFVKEFSAEKKENEERDVAAQKVKVEKKDLHKQINTLEDELHMLQQYNRNKNVEVH